MSDTFSDLSVHLVFATKHRFPAITEPVREVLFPYMGGIVNRLGGTTISIGGMPDHVHVVARLPTHICVADAVRKTKANSSKWMNQNKTNMKFGWQSGYGAFSVSQSALPAVVAYVRKQKQHHRKQSFADEFTALLTRHEIEFDPRYLP